MIEVQIKLLITGSHLSMNNLDYPIAFEYFHSSTCSYGR